MAKLTVKLDCEFKAGPVLIYDKKINDMRPIEKSNLKDILGTVDQHAFFALNVVFLGPEDGYPDVGFMLKKKSLKKGGVFNVTLEDKTGFLLVTIKGSLESSSAKEKDASRVLSYGNKADLRLQSFDYKDFLKDGFTAAIRGQKESNSKTWYKLVDWDFK